jgi:hypothetical protein
MNSSYRLKDGWVLTRTAHQAASFLPWHRKFVDIFETTLRQTCAFSDPLPYWDWALDWSSPSNSPIWDPEHGFGGDGNITGSFIINEGRCLVDGPFVEMRPLYDNYTANPHCISRGFKNVEINAAGTLSGDALRPEGMDEILGQENFKRFHDSVEQTVHDSLHNGINGDFGSLTSANGSPPRLTPVLERKANDINIKIRCSTSIMYRWIECGGCGRWETLRQEWRTTQAVVSFMMRRIMLGWMMCFRTWGLRRM